MIWNIAHMLHVLSAAIWIAALVATVVGVGMLAQPEPDDGALKAYRKLSKQIVMWIHIALIVSWVTGIWMMFFFYDGFGDVDAHVNIMFFSALVMTVVLIASMAGPTRRYSKAASNAATREALTGVRNFAMIGLILGLLTITVAAFGSIST